MTSESTAANPFANWQEWFQKSAEGWSKILGGASTNDATAKSRDLFESWSDSWVKFFSQPSTPDVFQAGQQAWRQQMESWTRYLTGAFKAQNSDPSEIWRQMVSAWTDSWVKALTQMPSPDLRRAAQSIWSEQFETWTNQIAAAMNEKPFADAMSQSAEQWLTAQENIQSALHPQVDATLRLLNIPSRSQVNRLFEEIADVQSRLQSLADENRVILRELLSRAPAPPPGD
jgi:hypothetical protein